MLESTCSWQWVKDLDKSAFERILGFLTDVLKRNAEIYEEQLSNLARENIF